MSILKPADNYPVNFPDFVDWVNNLPDNTYLGKTYVPQDNPIAWFIWEQLGLGSLNHEVAYSLNTAKEFDIRIGSKVSTIQGTVYATPMEFETILDMLCEGNKTIVSVTAGEVKELI